MESSLTIQGKKFISSRRASEITGYTIDYVGQLCRADKVESQMIGRTRFVYEDSLLKHQAQNGKNHKNPAEFKESIQSFFKTYRARTPVPKNQPIVVVTREVKLIEKLRIKSPFVNLEILPKDFSRFQEIATLFLISVLVAGSYLAFSTGSVKTSARIISEQSAAVSNSVGNYIDRFESVFQASGLQYGRLISKVTEVGVAAVGSVGEGFIEIGDSAFEKISLIPKTIGNIYLSYLKVSGESLADVVSDSLRTYGFIFSQAGKGLVAVSYGILNSYEVAIDSVAFLAHATTDSIIQMELKVISLIASPFSNISERLPFEKIQAFPKVVFDTAKNFQMLGRATASALTSTIGFGREVFTFMADTANKGLAVIYSRSSNRVSEEPILVSESKDLAAVNFVEIEMDSGDSADLPLFSGLKLSLIEGVTEGELLMFDIGQNISDVTQYGHRATSDISDGVEAFFARLSVGAETRFSNTIFALGSIKDSFDWRYFQLSSQAAGVIESIASNVSQGIASISNYPTKLVSKVGAFGDILAEKSSLIVRGIIDWQNEVSTSFKRIGANLGVSVKNSASTIQERSRKVSLNLRNTLNVVGERIAYGGNSLVFAWQSGAYQFKTNAVSIVKSFTQNTQALGAWSYKAFDEGSDKIKLAALLYRFDLENSLQNIALGFYARMIVILSPDTYLALVSEFLQSESRNPDSQVSSVRAPKSVDGRLGIAVVSRNDSVSDDEVKRQIRETFSDEIEIYPDDTGTAGLIKPVFKRVTDDEYIYVLVPIRN